MQSDLVIGFSKTEFQEKVFLKTRDFGPNLIKVTVALNKKTPPKLLYRREAQVSGLSFCQKTFFISSYNKEIRPVCCHGRSKKIMDFFIKMTIEKKVPTTIKKFFLQKCPPNIFGQNKKNLSLKKRT